MRKGGAIKKKWAFYLNLTINLKGGVYYEEEKIKYLALCDVGYNSKL